MGVDRVHAAYCIRKFFTDNKMIFSVGNHKPEKFKQIFVFFQKSPVQPGNFVILTVTVVISVLGISEFVTGKEHRCSAAAQKHCAGVSYHAVSKLQNLGIVCLTLCAAVPASVVVCSVCIVPAVIFIMLFVIRIKIIQSKAVVAGQKVDTGIIACVIATL